MKTTSLFAVFAFVLLSGGLIYAQTSTIDEVYLKNGSIIRGTIIEIIPNEKISIRTSDGSVFVFKMDEVAKIVKAEAQPAPQATAFSIPKNPYNTQMLISGIGLAATWAATVVVALSRNDATLSTTIIPVVGPFISIARVGGSKDLVFQSGGKEQLLISGIVQTGFLITFVVGAILSKSYNKRVSVSASTSPLGFAIRYNF